MSLCFWKISIPVLLCGLSTQSLASRPRASTHQKRRDSLPAPSSTAPSRPAAMERSALAKTPAAEPKDTPTGDTSIGCDADPDCAEAVQRAINQSEAQQYAAALRTYEAVYQRWPTPWLLINLGRVQQKLHLPERAVASYQRYLQSAPNGKSQRVTVARAFLKQAEQEIELKRFQLMLDEVKTHEKPLYKKWWLWATLVGGVGAAATIGAVAGTQAVNNRQPSSSHVMFLVYQGAF